MTGPKHNFNRLPGIKNVQVDLKSGIARFGVIPGNFLDPRKVWKAVLDSGFTPKWIETEGKLSHQENNLSLAAGKSVYLLRDPSHRLKTFQDGQGVVMKARLVIEGESPLPILTVLEAKQEHA